MPSLLPAPSPLCHTGGFTATNGYAFPTPEGWIGVDAPEGFAAWLTSKNLHLSALLLTHAHFDHVMDAAAVVRDHKCPVYAWEASSRETRLEVFLLEMGGIELCVEEYSVDHPLKCPPEKNLQVCGVEINFALVPGHSADSVIFCLPSFDWIFSGDTLMQGAIGRTDFPGGSTEQLLEGIRKEILTKNNQTMLFPGHGEPTRVGMERAWIECYRE